MQNPSPLPSLIQSQAAVYGNRAAMLYRDDEQQKWKEISWENFARTVSRVSASLLELGVGVQENIATFSQNMPECMYVDFGAYGIDVRADEEGSRSKERYFSNSTSTTRPTAYSR